MGSNLKEEGPLKNLSVYLDEIDKVLVSIYERYGPNKDAKKRKKIRTKKSRHLKSLRSIKSELPVEILEER